MKKTQKTTSSINTIAAAGSGLLLISVAVRPFVHSDFMSGFMLALSLSGALILGLGIAQRNK